MTDVADRFTTEGFCFPLDVLPGGDSALTSPFMASTNSGTMH